MSLGTWGRFLVLVTGGLLVIVAVVIVACFVGPGCWGFEYLHKVSDENKKKSNSQRTQRKAANHCKLQPTYHWLENRGFVGFETSPFLFETKVSKVNETPVHNLKERTFGLKCAPLLVAPNLCSVTKTPTPRLEIRMCYSVLDQEDISGQFTVQIISATSLPFREYIASLDPSVLLEILNNKWSLQKNERVVRSTQTRVIKNNINPLFNETFVFDAKKIEIKNWCLKLTIVDNDYLTKATPLFERRIPLKEVKNLPSNKHISFNLEMQEVVENLGALFLGISYLPTAQRLNIGIVRAAKLKYQTSVQSLGEFHPFVRVVMVNNHGKCVKKKKTRVKHGDENPTFDQSLVFDLSISNLEQTVFLILLCTKATGPQTNSDDSSLDGDVETCLQESKDKVLGTIVLGRNVRCTRARDHWVTVMQNPRKMISVWHDLKGKSMVGVKQNECFERSQKSQKTNLLNFLVLK